jgi:hypothetical protein
MSLIEELNQLNKKKTLNHKGNSLLKMILESLSKEERDTLNAALENEAISSYLISELLLKYNHEVSVDSVRRYRVRMRRNVSN